MLPHTYQLLYKNGRWDTSTFVSWQWAPADPKRGIKKKTVYLFQTVSESSSPKGGGGEGPNGDLFFEIKKEYIFTRENEENIYVLPEIFFVHGVPPKEKNQELEESLGIKFTCENLLKKAQEKKELYHHYFDLENTHLATKMSQTVYVKEDKVYLLRNDAEVKGVTKADLNVAYTNLPYASLASVHTWVQKTVPLPTFSW